MTDPKLFNVMITYTNGSSSERGFKSYLSAVEYCQSGISYTGGRIRRVTLREPFGTGEGRAMWDSEWDSESQQAGLRG